MKFVRYLIVSVVVVAIGLLGSLVKPANEAALAQGQVGCTVTVQPGESIQAAIDRAPEGAVICLTEGTWHENIVIEKSLTLRGAGQEKTVIYRYRVKEGYPMVLLRNGWREQEVLVQLEGLRITGAGGEGVCGREGLCANGILLKGSVQAIISNSTISEHQSGGIALYDSSQATISNSTISGNGYIGIKLFDSSQATITNSNISENGDAGIWLMDSAQATISGSTISGNREDGIELVDSAKATISGSTISGNGYTGIGLNDSSQATISNSTISGNWYNGIAVLYSAQLTLKESTVEKNGTDPDCAKADRICNGITVSGKSQTTIIDCKIINNTDWGIAAYLKKCGYNLDLFTGKVEFQGTNVITGNGAGQVCLP